jgi:hypothetical protein
MDANVEQEIRQIITQAMQGGFEELYDTARKIADDFAIANQLSPAAAAYCISMAVGQVVSERIDPTELAALLASIRLDGNPELLATDTKGRA